MLVASIFSWHGKYNILNTLESLRRIVYSCCTLPRPIRPNDCIIFDCVIIKSFPINP